MNDSSKKDRVYLCIDLKSFYASVECVERNLDPLTVNLVVADKERTEKTICLAVTPSLKAFGISGRARLFEVVKAVSDINKNRRYNAPNRKFSGKSYDSKKLKDDPSLELDYVTAVPRMALYIKYSARIYDIYLKYVSSDDILVYSIDEVFMDITDYLTARKTTPKKLAKAIVSNVLKETGITATVGIGTNMYLAKIAMDITAKKMAPDKDGVRIAVLNEDTYRRQLWNHRPITDFWRVGHGYSDKLYKNRMFTMGDIAEASLGVYGRRTLKKIFGINAKMLIDHAWGYEPCTIKEAKEYVPDNKSIGCGQVLQEAYTNEEARIVLREMLEEIALDLTEKKFLTDQIVLTIGYDVVNLKNKKEDYKGEIKIDMYGRKIPKHAHGTANLGVNTASVHIISNAVLELYDKITDKNMFVRRINLAANNVVFDGFADKNNQSYKTDKYYEQTDMFSCLDHLSDGVKAKKKAEKEKADEKEKLMLKKENSLQKAMISLKNQFGKNAVIKGASLQKGATGMERNNQIGGHKA